MTNKDPIQFFEGAEKLLEIWFTGSKNNDDEDLRKIPRQKLESLLKLVHCEVISFSSNKHIDAYVLSESSMFVSRRRFILKTCGTTTPLQCVKLLLILVQHYSGFHEMEEMSVSDQILDCYKCKRNTLQSKIEGNEVICLIQASLHKVFYSHKNFKRPDFQHNLYTDFKKEITFLDSFFKNKGTGYCIKNGDDQWYLYSLYSQKISNYGNSFTKLCSEPDQTIEILMSELDPEVMDNFNKNRFFKAKEVTKHCGIDKLIPLMEIDDYLFNPCGYSMNGILQNGSYMTIHVTPESEFSYVSFETNVPLASYNELIRRVVKIFQPDKFIVTLMANQKSVAVGTSRDLKNLSNVEEQWRQLSSKLCYVGDYDMTVAFYSKFPS